MYVQYTHEGKGYFSHIRRATAGRRSSLRAGPRRVSPAHWASPLAAQPVRHAKSPHPPSPNPAPLSAFEPSQALMSLHVALVHLVVMDEYWPHHRPHTFWPAPVDASSKAAEFLLLRRIELKLRSAAFGATLMIERCSLEVSAPSFFASRA